MRMMKDIQEIRRMGVMSDEDLQKIIDRETGNNSNKQTNADRIRAMSDEELAEFIANDCLEIADDICGSCTQETTENCGSGCCVEHIVSWLKKEVK